MVFLGARASRPQHAGGVGFSGAASAAYPGAWASRPQRTEGPAPKAWVFGHGISSAVLTDAMDSRPRFREDVLSRE